MGFFWKAKFLVYYGATSGYKQLFLWGNSLLVLFRFVCTTAWRLGIGWRYLRQFLPFISCNHLSGSRYVLSIKCHGAVSARWWLARAGWLCYYYWLWFCSRVNLRMHHGYHTTSFLLLLLLNLFSVLHQPFLYFRLSSSISSTCKLWWKGRKHLLLNKYPFGQEYAPI